LFVQYVIVTKWTCLDVGLAQAFFCGSLPWPDAGTGGAADCGREGGAGLRTLRLDTEGSVGWGAADADGSGESGGGAGRLGLARIGNGLSWSAQQSERSGGISVTGAASISAIMSGRRSRLSRSPRQPGAVAGISAASQPYFGGSGLGDLVR
jgi:hypothetical protein